jgi:hypothetical protein
MIIGNGNHHSSLKKKEGWPCAWPCAPSFFFNEARRGLGRPREPQLKILPRSGNLAAAGIAIV